MDRSRFSLQDWLSWLESSHPITIDLGLERPRQVYERLRLDFSHTQVITLAGTNGKGSTLAMLDSIFAEAGYSRVCYTSPHLCRYNERVSINGNMATDQDLIAAFQAIDSARKEVSLTYFEMGTLAALWLVAREAPDVALLEVGLGGRLDAVNLMDADLCAVTTIAIDHVDWLGDNREQIGYEKAGIFRAGRPAVCGDLAPPESIAEQALKLGTPLWQAGRDFSFSDTGTHWHWNGTDHTGQPVALQNLPYPNLPLQNAATALQLVYLTPLVCSASAIRAGLENAALPGRMSQLTYRGQHFILDVAHNPQSAAYLASILTKKQLAPVTLVLGMLADKDCQSVIAQLQPVVATWRCVTLDTPRGQTAAELAELVRKQSGESDVLCFESVASALHHCMQAPEKHSVLVAGSFHTVGQAYDCLEQDLS